MLMAAGLPVTHTVFGHGFLLTKGEKMSKSKGNALKPADLCKVFGVDAYRYYFMSDVQFGADGSISMAVSYTHLDVYKRQVLGMVGVSVYILADTFFIANGVGSDGLAALNFSIVLYTVLQATGLMLGIGAATEFQVCSACGDRTGANRVFTTALVMAGVAAAVLLAVVEAFAAPLSSLLGADEATLPLTVTYLRTIFAFAPLFLLNNVLLPFVRNDGSPQLAMVAMLVGSFGNIALDALLSLIHI